jgi:hypothetical protein
MTKQYIPLETAMTAKNSRLTGVSIDRHGNIRQLRVRIEFPRQKANEPLVVNQVKLNPISI